MSFQARPEHRTAHLALHRGTRPEQRLLLSTCSCCVRSFAPLRSRHLQSAPIGTTKFVGILLENSCTYCQALSPQAIYFIHLHKQRLKVGWCATKPLLFAWSSLLSLNIILSDHSDGFKHRQRRLIPSLYSFTPARFGSYIPRLVSH